MVIEFTKEETEFIENLQKQINEKGLSERVFIGAPVPPKRPVS